MKFLATNFGFSIMLCLVSNSVLAASTVLYFPSDYTPTSNPPEDVTRVSAFAPICDDSPDIYTPRLPGLDSVRGFSEAVTCPNNAVSDRLATQADYVFLIDDTSALSDYLKQQLRDKNALQSSGGREVVRPTVVRFSGSESNDFSVLVVGEVIYRSRGGSSTWLAVLNQRFDESEIAAGNGSTDNDDDDQIRMAYHGSFYDKLGRLVEDITPEKIAAFLQKQLQQLGSAASNTPSTGGAAPTVPPLPNRPLNDYMRECHSESVPLPPVWNPRAPTTSDWVRRGAVANPFTARGLPNVELWAYLSTSPDPEGVCFALPRMDGTGDINSDIQALGIICQSEQTGKACFWDNVRRPPVNSSERRPGDGTDKIVGADTIGLDPVNMRDGYNLVENCTACHRGYNAFLVQYGTPLHADRQGTPRLDIQPSRRYAPLSGTPPTPSWGNPVSTTHQFVDAATTASGQSVTQCTSCHSLGQENEIAEVTYDYCRVVMCGSIGVNMPPGRNSANWRAGYEEEVAAISEKCCAQGIDLQKRDSSGQPYHSLSSCPTPQPAPGVAPFTCPPPPITPNP